MIRIFVGYDRNEPVIFNTYAHSLIQRSTRPLSITPIHLQHLQGVFDRELNPLQSTEFSFSRFLVPYLCNYEGWALFTDNDFLARADISKLWDMRDDQYAVMCVKHDHVPKENVKFKGSVQTQYEKKNWSSAMLFNCAKCKNLTANYVNTATGLELHQFKWLDSEDLIGEIPMEWNYLVDYYKHNESAKLLHYTEGGPYFPEYANCDYAQEWYDVFLDSGKSSSSDMSEILDRALGKQGE